jgi:TonB family protein
MVTRSQSMKISIALFYLMAIITCICLVGSDKATSQDIRRKPWKTPPQMVSMAKPMYTEEAVHKEIEGTVLLSVTINKEGKVINPVIVQGLGHGLDQQAIEAVRATRFLPAKDDNGSPIEVRNMKLGAEFNLFDIRIVPEQKASVAGEEIKLAVTAEGAVHGVKGPVALSCRIIPSEKSIMAYFERQTTGFEEPANLIVKTSSSTRPGKYTIQVSGKAGKSNHKAEAIIDISLKAERTKTK